MQHPTDYLKQLMYTIWNEDNKLENEEEKERKSESEKSDIPICPSLIWYNRSQNRAKHPIKTCLSIYNFRLKSKNDAVFHLTKRHRIWTQKLDSKISWSLEFRLLPCLGTSLSFSSPAQSILSLLVVIITSPPSNNLVPKVKNLGK